ncbi:hypothetical protein BD779DRAFT_1788350 [Infundibulicybe gibba]|nr:hypothetical protein BD779DRAFT_1788350 [Infundibulicybe gibba]
MIPPLAAAAESIVHPGLNPSENPLGADQHQTASICVNPLVSERLFNLRTPLKSPNICPDADPVLRKSAMNCNEKMLLQIASAPIPLPKAAALRQLPNNIAIGEIFETERTAADGCDAAFNESKRTAVVEYREILSVPTSVLALPSALFFTCWELGAGQLNFSGPLGVTFSDWELRTMIQLRMGRLPEQKDLAGNGRPSGSRSAKPRQALKLLVGMEGGCGSANLTSCVARDGLNPRGGGGGGGGREKGRRPAGQRADSAVAPGSSDPVAPKDDAAASAAPQDDEKTQLPRRWCRGAGGQRGNNPRSDEVATP